MWICDTWSWSHGNGKSINYDIKCIDVRATSDVFRSVNTLTQYTTVQQILNVKCITWVLHSAGGLRGLTLVQTI